MNDWSIQLLDANYQAVGQPQTLAALGIENFSVDENNLAADVGTFTVGGKAIDAAALWPYGTTLVVLRPDGSRAFFGRVEPWSREGNPEAQNHGGRLVNPWWYLVQKIYQQRYPIATGNYPVVGQPAGNVTYTVVSTPRVVLNVLYNAITGSGFYSATTGQQIADAVNWAISQGAPIKLGVTDPATQPFSEFQKGITCAQVIQSMYRKEPDFVVDWDYSTTPFPTLHFRKMASLTPVTIDLTQPGARENITIKERPAWQRSDVNIHYDQSNSQPGGAFLSLTNDLYPNPVPAGIENQFRGVDLYCDLAGFTIGNTSSTALFASIPFNINNQATWLNWVPELASGTVSSIQLMTDGDPSRPNPTLQTLNELDDAGNVIAYDPTCLYEVVDGQWADWIPGVNAQRVRALAWFRIVQKNGEIKYHQHHHDMTVVSLNTNGIKREFTQATSNVTSYAEPQPVGLAQAMWNSWHALAIEGSFTHVAAVAASLGISRSNTLNFLTANPGQNGNPDWRNVNALVQRRTWDVLRGTTAIQFGAPLKITGHDLIDAVRATRFRTTTVDINYLFGGPLGGGSSNKLMRAVAATAAGIRRWPWSARP